MRQDSEEVREGVCSALEAEGQQAEADSAGRLLGHQVGTRFAHWLCGEPGLGNDSV